MNDSAPAIFVALEASGLGAAIRQSTWAYMVANVVHILALMAFAGAIVVMDLRMMGVFAATSPGFILRWARWAAVAAFAGLVLSGLVLFTAEASHVVLNRIFQIKIGLIALGLANILAFEVWVTPNVQNLPPATPLPAPALPIAIISLSIWFCVAACGRLIAYF
ncbi:DUF6644 family protein [Bradyrhizobium sp. LHD-71]|uniref:DUF6644 family protein n=1 Tax=Bradyrhizobium sp. LHD-71 TaxID=3072141 RepID=UPI00280F7BCF|nr:DUF6644 family protein [Bradyrhizobium sp. LHD-71]MDQ8730378.1 hypothetical protein [Bradyrhizobium sp. LHD-71]